MGWPFDENKHAVKKAGFLEPTIATTTRWEDSQETARFLSEKDATSPYEAVNNDGKQESYWMGIKNPFK